MRDVLRVQCGLLGHDWEVPGVFLRPVICGYLEEQTCRRCGATEIVQVPQ